MSILLQTLTESKSIRVKAQGHSNYLDLKDMSDLSILVTRKVVEPIKKHMKPNEFMIGLHDPVMVGGNDYHENNGDLYIYIGQFKDNWRPRILGGVDHLLNQLGVKTETWKVQGKDYQDDKKCVIIPVLRLPTSDDPSPEILMTGGSLEKIKELLSLGEAFDNEKRGSLSLKIAADSLKELIEDYFKEVEKGLSSPPPNTTIRYYLQEMLELTDWAIKHKLDYIVAH